ncbi:hypothetical protein EKD04_020920 [Chloroflexales bacterium ZM16-3]|nr:hypothetical protein [Chloroflexales bacterium ZM16-3]
MELLPGTYTFRVSYAGGRQTLRQDIGTNPLVQFTTKHVTVELRDSAGAPLAGDAEYNVGGWQPFGTGTTPATMELLPGTYTFRVSYAGGRQTLRQDIGANPLVQFTTKHVAVEH